MNTVYHIGSWIIVAFSPDGTTLVTAGIDGLIVVWDVATGTDRATLFAHTDMIGALAFSPDGRHFVSAGLGETLLWELASGELRWRITQTSPPAAIAYSPDGATIVVAGGGELTFWAVR